MVSSTYSQLRDSVLATFVEVLPLFGLVEDVDYTINKSDMDLCLRGTMIHMRSAEIGNKLRGINCHDVLIDEARNMRNDSVFLILIGRMRMSEDGQCLLCTTPRGKDWVYKLGLDATCELITQKTEENPFLPRKYIEDLRRKYTSQYAKQELDAEVIEMSAGVIRSSWFIEVPYVKPTQGVRAWDLSVSIKTHADFIGGTLMFMQGTRICIGNIVHGRFEYPDLRQKIIDTARYDGKNVHIIIEEAGQQKGFIDDLKSIPELRGYVIKAIRPKGDKYARAMPWASRAQLGGVVVCQAEWNSAFYDECDAFTADMQHDHDDQIDATSMAYQALTEPVGSSSRVNLY